MSDVQSVKKRDEKLRVQKDLIHERAWDILIILDACRYDVFSEEIPYFLDGDLQAVESQGCDTGAWFGQTWTGDYPDITYCSGAVPVNSALTSGHLFPGGYEIEDHIPNVIDVWDYGWDPDYGICPPEPVAYEAKRQEPPLVAHMFQPHAPFIGEPTLLGHTGWRTDSSEAVDAPVWQSFFSRSAERVEVPGWEEYFSGGITEEKLRAAYRGNLQRALETVQDLVRYYIEHHPEYSIYVTADHGDLLGEHGEAAHGRERIEKYLKKGHRDTFNELYRLLTTVPWFRVEGVTESE